MTRWIVLVAMILLTACTPQAVAAPLVAVDDAAPKLAASDDEWTGSLGFTNLTDDDDLRIQAAAVGAAGCELKLGKAPGQVSVALRSAVRTKVGLTAETGCVASGKTLVIDVTARAGSSSQIVRLRAPAKDDSKPDWTQLRFFVWAAIALALLAFVLWAFWDGLDGKPESLWEPMPYVEDTWNFKDTWAGNITLGGGLLTGIFGSSEVVKTVFGDDAEASIALATIGAAIAVGLVAAGALIALSTKRGGNFTIGGVLAASIVTLTGAAGELWLVSRAGIAETEGSRDDLISAIAIVGLVLLVFYAGRSLWETFELGTTPPDPVDHLDPPLSETMFATKMIVAALGCQCPPNVLDDAVERLRIANFEAGIAALKERPDVDAEQLEKAIELLKAMKGERAPSLVYFALADMLDTRMLARRKRARAKSFDAGALAARLGVDVESLERATTALEGAHEKVDKPRAASAVEAVLGGAKTAAVARQPTRARRRAAMI